MPLSAFKFPTVDDRVFNGVTQGAVRVVGGVRTHQHIRHFLEPQQLFAFNGMVSAIGVEYSFFSLENVQRRTTKPAAFQRRNKGLGIKEWTASSIDDERAALHPLDTLAIEEMVRIRIQGCMERDNITLP